MLSFTAAETIADTVILVNGDIVTELNQKRNGPINGAAIDFDAIEGQHLCNDLPHGQNMFRIGIFFQDLQKADGIGFSVSMIRRLLFAQV